MKTYWWLIVLLFSVGCQKGTGTTDDNSAVSFMNVSYGSDARQKMDVYLPAGRNTGTTKVIILIHGGGWMEGDKADFAPYISLVQEKLAGYAIFNINYRLASSGNNLFPAQENDVKAAVEFIYSKRNEYRLSDKFVYLGASAGGHLSLLQAYKYNSPIKPKAVVSFFGPTDLAALYNTNVLAAAILFQATGTTPGSNSALYQQSSPAAFVNSSAPPTLLLQGGADPLVPPSQATSLQTLLNNVSVPNQYVFYPSEGHGWTGNNLTDSFNKIAAFLNAHVN